MMARAINSRKVAEARVGIHKDQAEQLKTLGISHRAAARDLEIPHATFSAYLLCGRLPARLQAGDFVERLHSYIKKRLAQVSGGEYRTAPMRGKFTQLGVSVEQVAEATSIDHLVVRRGIYGGLWPDENTKRSIESWIDRRIDLGEKTTMINPIALAEEVLEAYHLKIDPWGEVKSPDDILMHKEIAQALKMCKATIDRGEMLAITGPVGSGKTVVLRKLEEWTATRPDIIPVKPAVIEKQYLRGSHIVSAILEDLGMSPGSRHTLEHLARFLMRALEQARSDGRIVVLIIDEAHLVPPETLLCLKRLFEIEKNGEKLLRIILVGQPVLARQLRTNFQLSELGQRIRLFELGGLNGATGAYLRHRLDRAGASGREIFDGSAIKAIAKKCATPLEANCMAGAAMLAAFSIGEKIVTQEAVEMIQGGYRK